MYEIQEKIKKSNIPKPQITPKRVYDYNPNFLSNKNLFEWNLENEKKENKKISNFLNLKEKKENNLKIENSKFDKYTKIIFKSPQHHKQ